MRQSIRTGVIAGTIVAVLGTVVLATVVLSANDPMVMAVDVLSEMNEQERFELLSAVARDGLATRMIFPMKRLVMRRTGEWQPEQPLWRDLIDGGDGGPVLLEVLPTNRLRWLTVSNLGEERAISAAPFPTWFDRAGVGATLIDEELFVAASSLDDAVLIKGNLGEPTKFTSEAVPAPLCRLPKVARFKNFIVATICRENEGGSFSGELRRIPGRRIG